MTTVAVISSGTTNDEDNATIKQVDNNESLLIRIEHTENMLLKIFGSDDNSTIIDDFNKWKKVIKEKLTLKERKADDG
jgi:hypothetical protein